MLLSVTRTSVSDRVTSVSLNVMPISKEEMVTWHVLSMKHVSFTDNDQNCNGNDRIFFGTPLLHLVQKYRQN